MILITIHARQATEIQLPPVQLGKSTGREAGLSSEPRLNPESSQWKVQPIQLYQTANATLSHLRFHPGTTNQPNHQDKAKNTIPTLVKTQTHPQTCYHSTSSPQHKYPADPPKKQTYPQAHTPSKESHPKSSSPHPPWH